MDVTQIWVVLPMRSLHLSHWPIPGGSHRQLEWEASTFWVMRIWETVSSDQFRSDTATERSELLQSQWGHLLFFWLSGCLLSMLSSPGRIIMRQRARCYGQWAYFRREWERMRPLLYFTNRPIMPMAEVTFGTPALLSLGVTKKN